MLLLNSHGLINKGSGNDALDTRWDDIRVPVSAAESIGTFPAALGQFQNDGTAQTGNAIYTGSNSATIPSNAQLTENQGDLSISFWIKPDAGYAANNRILNKQGEWYVQLQGDLNIRVNIPGLGNFDTDLEINPGAINHIVVVMEDTGSDTNVSIWINGELDDVQNDGARRTDTDGIIYVGTRTGSNNRFDGVIDELRFWNTVLVQADVDTLYNGGAGTENDVQAGSLLAGYHFSENSGTTVDNFEGTAALDMTLASDTMWVDGLLSVSAPSRGVFTHVFPPGVDRELHFTLQMPHRYIEGSALDPHIHWSPMDATGGNVRWGLEYTISSINSTFGITSTQVVTAAAGTTALKHLVTDFGDISGSGLTISFMLTGRIFRNGTDGADTYGGDCALHEFDLHTQVDDLGSRQEYIK